MEEKGGLRVKGGLSVELKTGLRTLFLLGCIKNR